MSRTREQMKHNLALFDAAHRLGFEPEVRRALSLVNSFTEELVRKGLSWHEVPEKYDLKDMMPGLPGKITLAIVSRTPGWPLFEAAVFDPQERTPLLGAYEDCLRLNPNGTSLTRSEVFTALHAIQPQPPR